MHPVRSANVSSKAGAKDKPAICSAP